LLRKSTGFIHAPSPFLTLPHSGIVSWAVVGGLLHFQRDITHGVFTLATQMP
jgi:hypothetical protein